MIGLMILVELQARGRVSFNTDQLDPQVGKWIVFATSIFIWLIFIVVEYNIIHKNL